MQVASILLRGSALSSEKTRVLSSSAERTDVLVALGVLLVTLNARVVADSEIWYRAGGIEKMRFMVWATLTSTVLSAVDLTISYKQSRYWIK